MKKLILLACCALLLTGCSQQPKPASSGLTPLEDSLSRMNGTGWGNTMAQQMADSNNTMDRDEFLRGLELALVSDSSRQSYLTGISVGMQILDQIDQLEDEGVRTNRTLLLQAFKQAFSKKGGMTEAQIMTFRQQLQQLTDRVLDEQDARTLRQGNAYIASQLKADKALRRTGQGLVYKITRQGSGPVFKTGDYVLVKYHGTHIDGSTYSQSQGAEVMPVDSTQIITGLAQMLQLMRPGAKAHVIVPAYLAYGSSGDVDQNTGEMMARPNETLVFDIEAVRLASKKQIMQYLHPY